MHVYILKVLSITLLGIIFVSSFCMAQPISKILDKKEQDLILKKTGRLLKENYVFTDIGAACAEFLSNQRDNNTYEQINHPRAFVKQLNKDLRGIHQDKHIRIQYISEQDRKIAELDPLLNFFLHTRDKIKANMGITELKILSGNVGYIQIRVFEPLELARKKILNALYFLENSDALIVDLRNNIGGNPATIQYICSWFFQQPTHLNSIYWRNGDYTEEFWTMDQIGISKRPDIPLYILISNRTFSGGEEFAYNLKAQQRAMLIGETTAGGANPGYSFRINERFTIFIPTGRSEKPVTGTNWEGVGVQPDIRTTSRDASSVALERAQSAARVYREKTDEIIIDEYFSLSNLLNQTAEKLTNNKSDSIENDLRRALSEAIKNNRLNEWMINDLGYRYLNKENLQIAKILFQANCEFYPGSFNVYDSMGEYYLKSGDIEKATEFYQKSLELNPQNDNARHMLQQIESGHE